MKTFFVQTDHPLPEYGAMFVEANSEEQAEAMAERISGRDVWSCTEFVDNYNGEVFTEEFVTFLDSKTGTWH